MVKAVSVRGISKRYDNFVALDNVDLDIAQGEFVSLLGPSGAGKTTILRMIGGFDYPDEGEVKILDQNVVDLPSHKRPVNTVFQNYALFPHMTVADNVAYGLRQEGVPASERKARVRETLEMVEMIAMSHRKPDALSGGQQQRVALARALVKRPSILLLDEPLGALDRRLRQQMQIELKKLQRETGIAFVLVTHDQEEALAMSDRIVITRNGRVEQTGTPSELYDTPKTAFVADFIGSQNFFRGTLDAGNRTVTTSGGRQFHAARVASDAGTEALAAVRPEKTIIRPARPKSADNIVEGEILQILHLGNIMEFVVQLATGEEVFSRRPREESAGLAMGSPVWLSWLRDDMTVFRMDDEIAANLKGAAPRQQG